MSEQSYYQPGAEGKGNPEGISQTTSDEPISPNVVSQELNGNEPVTKEQLRSVVEDLEKSILRKAQSLTDKLGSTLDKRIKSAQDEAGKAISMLKASGVSLTPEQERTISQTAVNQAIAARDDSPAVPERGKQEAIVEPGDFVNKEVQRIMSDTGVYISPEEAQVLIGQVRSPYEFIRKFEDICAQRTTKPQAETRIPTLAPTTGRATQSVDVLKRQYDDEIAQINKGTHPNIRRGQTEAITKMKAEYRKKGLDVY
jgi:hypothetical protein